MTRHEPRYIRINNCGECLNAYIKDSCLCCDKACGDSVDCYDGNAESRGWALVKTNGRWHYMCPKCRGKE